MSRVACWLLFGHRRRVLGARPVRVVSEGIGEWDATDVLYRCTRCSLVISQRVKGDWTRDQVLAP